MMTAAAPRQASLRRLALGATLAHAAAVAPLGAQSVPLHHYTVRASDGLSLAVWGKRPTAAPRATILLLHGRTWSSLPNFDLHVTGLHVSLMDALVRRGYAVYALDQRGYGATPRDSSGWITPVQAELDAMSALDWIAAQPSSRGAGRPVLLGYSRGSRTAMLAAQRHPRAMAALVLYGFSMNLREPPAHVTDLAAPQRERTTLAKAAEDFITPASTAPGVKDAYAAAAVAADPVRADWREENTFIELDPARVKVPVLLINGERDPVAAAADLPWFFPRLAAVDRSWVVLANTDHVAHLERPAEFVRALTGFIERVRAGMR